VPEEVEEESVQLESDYSTAFLGEPITVQDATCDGIVGDSDVE
jgi:hypothetical protein